MPNPNTIELAIKWVPVLDDIYKLASLTSALDGNADLATQGANANELRVPMMTMSGLLDYPRGGDYPDGHVEEHTQSIMADFDKGTMFKVDAMDNIETANIAFGRLAGEFIRTMVVPHVDAYRLSAYANAAGVTRQTGSLSTGADIVSALRACATAMDNAEVPDEQRILYITPALLGAVEDMDTIKSRAVMGRFGQIVRTPPSRLNMTITQKPQTSDTDSGGYSADGAAINFMALHRRATIQFTKHLKPKIISPDVNQRADAWLFGYRMICVTRVYENKTKGIYVHSEA